jgi:hypothetical protein
MAKYFFDCEFIEKPCSIDLISIGIISNDGRELYLESSEVDLSDVDPWIKENVIPHLKGRGIPRDEIRDAILSFVGEDERPEFWAYFAAYDWVVFCWLFGRMVNLPYHFPRYCRDFKQLMDDKKLKLSDLPRKPRNVHYALADARWLRDAYEWVQIHHD